jgi:hypothetical protein
LPGESKSQPSNEEPLARRGLDRPQGGAAPAPPAAKPDTESVAKKAPSKDSEILSDVPKAAPRPDDLVKLKAEVAAPGGKASSDPKDELTLNRPATAGRPAGAAAPEVLAQAGQNPPTIRGRLAGTQPADGLWSMRAGTQFGDAADPTGPRGGVIVARMNRRQADELRAALSREQGQRAELRDFGAITAPAATTPAGTTPAATALDATLSPQEAARGAEGPKPSIAGKPAAAAPRGDSAAAAATPAPSDGLRLTPHPMDEPVDVVIVVKPDAATPAASESGKPDTDAKK